MKKYPLRPLTWYALPLLICVILMSNFSPPAEKARDPYSSVVIAMEFAGTTGEIYDTLDPLNEEEIHGLNRLNFIDFFFMLVYSSLLGMFIWKFSNSIASAALKSFAWVAVFVFFADLGENIMMLRISSIYLEGGGDFSPYMNFLSVFTWAKWGTLAAIFAYLGIFLIQERLFSQILSILLFLPSILLAIVIVHNEWINRFTISIFLAFIAMLIFAVGYRQTDRSPA